jgi:hypothetical protein
MPEVVVTNEQDGRRCPYCHSPLCAGERAYECADCGSLHHDDCWAEGGGCAIFGCEGGNESQAIPDQGSEEDEVTIEVRRAVPIETEIGGPKDIRRRRKVEIACFVILVIAAVIGAIFLNGRDDGHSERKAATVSERAEFGSGTARTEERKQARRLTERRLLETLAPVWSEDPGGSWSGYVPSGRNWTSLVDEGNQSDGYVPRYLTTAHGPRGAFIAVHTTPNVDPTANEENYTVNGVRWAHSNVPAQHMDSANLFVYRNGPDECAEKFCATVLMSNGRGGGIAVVSGAKRREQALITVKRFASTVDPNFR